MLCPNCKQEILESSTQCCHCGAVVTAMETENNSKQSEVKTTTFKDKVGCVFFVLFWIVIIYYGIVWMSQMHAEKKFNQQIYQQAVNEIRSHLGQPDAVEIADYKKEYIVLREWDYHDFGYGNLRYARYEVTVPVSSDENGYHYEEDVAVNVYYYTSNQNVLEGINPMVEDHLFTPDMFQEKWDQMMEDVEMPTFQ